MGKVLTPATRAGHELDQRRSGQIGAFGRGAVGLGGEHRRVLVDRTGHGLVALGIEPAAESTHARPPIEPVAELRSSPTFVVGTWDRGQGVDRPLERGIERVGR